MSNNIINMNKEDLVKLLQEQLVEVTFNKIDGEERVMLCTLQANVIDSPTPATATENEDKPKRKKKPDNVVSAWDVNKDAWRSFRFENVTKVTPK